MFIKQQELRAHKRRHEQRKRLALTAREQPHMCGHAGFKTQAKHFHQFGKAGITVSAIAPAQCRTTSASVSDGQIF